jgi:hypothetical protein
LTFLVASEISAKGARSANAEGGEKKAKAERNGGPRPTSIQSEWQRWIGERLQCLLHGEKKLWRMCNGYVVDLIVIELRIAMRENVAEPYDVAGVGNRFRNGGATR